MSFNVEESKGGGGARTLYTGVMPVEIINICPTHAELQEMYGENAKAPTYVETVDGATRVRLDFYIRNEANDFLSKFSIFVKDAERISRTGKYEFLDVRGRNAWGESLESIDYDWFKTAGARKAKDGESRLIEMLVALTNANQDSEQTNIVIDMERIFAGDFSELRKINNNYGKGLKVLLGVRDGKYQDVYTNKFGRSTSNSVAHIQKAASDHSYPWNCDFGGSTDLKEYVAPVAPTDNVSVVTDTSGGDLF